MASGISPGGRPIDESPLSGSKTSNWVARKGGLPPYIRGVARGIDPAHPDSPAAIGKAIAAIKKWAAGGGGVKPAVKAAAVEALARWEAMKGSTDLAVPAFGGKKAAPFGKKAAPFGKVVTGAPVGAPDPSGAAVTAPVNRAVIIKRLKLLAEAKKRGLTVKTKKAPAVKKSVKVNLAVPTHRLVGDIDLADGHDWKHGYIPLTPKAVAEKQHGVTKPQPATKKLTDKNGKEVKVGDRVKVTSTAQSSRATGNKRVTRDHGEHTVTHVESDYRGEPVARTKKDGQKSPGLQRDGSDLEKVEPAKSAEPIRNTVPGENSLEGKPASQMTPADKIKAAETMHGTGSAQHVAAQQRFGGDKAKSLTPTQRAAATEVLKRRQNAPASASRTSSEPGHGPGTARRTQAPAPPKFKRDAPNPDVEQAQKDKEAHARLAKTRKQYGRDSSEYEAQVRSEISSGNLSPSSAKKFEAAGYVPSAAASPSGRETAAQRRARVNRVNNRVADTRGRNRNV